MLLFYVFITGLFIGSFLNMLIDRLPRGEQIISGRSKCDSCHHTLRWIDLVPVVSWVYLRGRCRYCHKKIPVRNTLVELMTAGLFVAAAMGAMDTVDTMAVMETVVRFIIISCLLVIFFIDLKHYIIPDILTIIVGVVGVAGWMVNPEALPYSNYLVSAISAGAFFLFLYFITKRRGMGMGDVKFAAVMGLLLGFPGVVVALYIAFLTGALASVILILRGKKRFGQTVPFGPFLVFGTLIVLLKLVPGPVWDLFIPIRLW